MTHVLIVGVGGFLGSILRYLLQGLAHRLVQDPFPVGTLAVNVLGCFAIGIFMFLVEYRQFFGSETRAFLIIGLLGGFTTFSTLGYESFVLLRDQEHLRALVSVATNVVLGIGAVAFGWMTAKALGI